MCICYLPPVIFQPLKLSSTMRVICHIPVARSAELLENDQRVGLECISFPEKTMRRGVPLKASKLVMSMSNKSYQSMLLPAEIT